MAEFIASIATVFGGVFGALIGFLFIGATAVLLTLPYILMNRMSDENRDAQDAISNRYV